MSVGLLDVNVLIALMDPAHINHDDAHHWFAKNRNRGWATCATTINSCARILANPKYPAADLNLVSIAGMLRTLCAAPGHHIWSESISLLDEKKFRVEAIRGPGQITDIYLLATAVHHRGKLVTFDRTIPREAVLGAGPTHLEILGRVTASS